MKNRIIFIWIFLLLPLSIFSQEKKWNASISIGSAYFSGNVNKFDATSEGLVAHKDSVFEFSTFYKVIYGEGAHVKNNEEYSGGIKFDWQPEAQFTPFLLLNVFRNQFNGYNFRFSGLIGAKYLIYKSETTDISLSAAFQFDNERYTPPTKTETPKKPDQDLYRLSIRPKLKFKINDAMTFDHYTFFKPQLNDFSNLQIESQTTISNKVTKMIYFKVGYQYLYESNPPSSDFVKENSSLVVSLVFKLN